MITFSVNERRFREEDYEKIARLLKELSDLNEKGLKTSDYADYKRDAVSKLISDLLNGEMKENIKSLSNYGERAHNEEILGKSRKQIGDEKVSHLRVDAPIKSKDGSEQSFELSDRNASIEDKVVAKEDREFHFKLLGIVEAHLNELGVSLIEVIDPLVDAVLVQTKEEVRNPRLTRDFVSHQKAALKFVTKYNNCLADIRVEPDGTTQTEEVILYLEQNTLLNLIVLIYQDKFL